MPTRTQYRQILAKDLGGFGPTMNAGGIATGGTTAGTLVQATWPMLSSIEKDNLYDGWYVLRPGAAAGDRVRQVIESGYRAKTGTLTVDAAYSVAPSNTEVYELHGHDFEPWYEVDELINQGLKLIMLPVQVPFIPYFMSSSLPQGNYTQNLTYGDGTGATHNGIPGLLSAGWVLRIDYLPYVINANGIKRVDVIESQIPAATMGTIDLTLNGITVTFAYDASQTTVANVLHGIPGFEEVAVTRTGSLGSYTWQILYRGAPLRMATFTVAGSGGFDGGVTPQLIYEEGSPIPMPARIYQNGPHVMAEFDSYFGATSTGDRLFVTCLVRAYDWCRASSSYSFGTQSGLSAEAHQAVPVEEFVSAAARLYAWKRSPRLMEEAVERRRVLALTDTQQEFNDYQVAYLKNAVRSPLLRYDVDGGPLSLSLPFSVGGAVPGPAARALAAAPAFTSQGG